MTTLWMLGNLLTAIGSAGLAEPLPSWTPAQVEQLAADALLRDGLSLVRLGNRLELSAMDNGRWQLLVEDVSGRTAPRVRVFDRLSSDPEVAATEVAAATRNLLEVGAAAPVGPPSVERPPSPLEGKAQIITRLREKSDPFGRTPPYVGAMLFSLGCALPTETASSSVVGSSTRQGFIIGGGAACLLGSFSGPLFSRQSDLQLKIPAAAFLLGTATILLASSYSPQATFYSDGTVRYAAGLRPATAVAGGTLLASGVATLAIAGRPYCGRPMDIELADAVAAASPQELPGRVDRFERCLREEVTQSQLWWVPLGLLGVGALGTAIAAAFDPNPPMSTYLLDGMTLIYAGFGVGVANTSWGTSLRYRYLKGLRAAGLTLEPVVGPGGVGVHGRF